MTDEMNRQSPSGPRITWQSPVPTPADLPLLGNQDGDVRVTTSTDELWIWTGTAWTPPSGLGTDEKVKVSAADTTPGFLATTKISAGPNVALSILNPGANESLQISVPSASATLVHELYVDPNGSDITGNGSILKPYQTIQFALDQIPAATTAAQSKQVFLIIISPADYDEDLSIDITGKRVILTSPGPWGLGTFDAVDWGPSGTLRNITISGVAASINGIRPGFAIANQINPGERQSTHQSYFTGARISGQILIPATVGSLEIDLEAEVFGVGGVALDASVSNPILQLYVYNGRYRGIFNAGTNSNFQHAERCRFDGLVTIGSYSLMDRCRFNAGFTALSATPGGVLPDGFINSFFAAGTTFTGPAASFRLDGYTNARFKLGACILAGGATKIIYDDDVP